MCVCVIQVPVYIGYVDKRLSEESEKLLYYLDQSTRFDNCLVIDVSTQISVNLILTLIILPLCENFETD